MRVFLPSNFNKVTMYDLLSKVVDAKLSPKSNELFFDFSYLQFIEPAGVTILSNLIQWLLKNNVKVVISYPDESANGQREALRFLDDSLFFQRYLKKKIFSESALRNTTLPLMCVKYEKSYTWLEHKLVPWLSKSLGLPEQSFTDIKMCFGELFNNIQDHAQENTGCVFAQHYPKLKQIKISISDFGIGIPSTVKRILPDLTDSQALRKAVEDGFSSKSNPGNRGAGLYTLLKNIVADNGGTVHIHSNHGILECVNINNEIVYTCRSESNAYPGTFLEIILLTDKIEWIDEEEVDLSWL